MDVTDEGIETLESDEHFLNEDSSISVIEESNFTEFISLFSLKNLLVAPVFCDFSSDKTSE